MLVDYKKVNIYQQADTPVLSDVDFHVDEGEFIYLIGRVGSGKSSLLKTVYFELDVDEAEEATVLATTCATSSASTCRRSGGRWALYSKTSNCWATERFTKT